MIIPKISVSGVGEVAIEMSAINQKVHSNVQAVIHDSAIRIRDDARSRAPFGTGKLKQDIRAKFSRDKFRASVTYMGKKKAFWGKFVEFGTEKMPARPFLGPAAEAEMPAYERNLIEAVNGGHK